MNIEDYILEATDLVIAWDIPEEELSEAIMAQAELMAGVNPEFID